MATEAEVQQAMERREEILTKLGEAYTDHLNDRMGVLYNQFVVYIASSQLPLPEVLVVLEMLLSETITQARQKYLGGD